MASYDRNCESRHPRRKELFVVLIGFIYKNNSSTIDENFLTDPLGVCE